MATNALIYVIRRYLSKKIVFKNQLYIIILFLLLLVQSNPYIYIVSVSTLLYPLFFTNRQILPIWRVLQERKHSLRKPLYSIQEDESPSFCWPTYSMGSTKHSFCWPAYSMGSIKHSFFFGKKRRKLAFLVVLRIT